MGNTLLLKLFELRVPLTQIHMLYTMLQTCLCLQRSRNCDVPHAKVLQNHRLSLRDCGIRADKEKRVDFICGNSVLAQLTPQCILSLPIYLSSTLLSLDEYLFIYFHLPCLWILVSTCTFIFILVLSLFYCTASP